MARYDGFATWYDEYLSMPFYDNVPAHVSRLVGTGSGLCLDVGCGTGVHLPLLESLGWSVVGVDVSADQLRLAHSRSGQVVLGDACDLPFAPGVFHRVVSVLTLTDLDDVEPFFAEARRLLHPTGRLVLLTTHPCFMGPFVRFDRDEGVAKINPGYRDTARVFEGPGIGDGVRSRVGTRHVPLAELLNKLIASGLRLESVHELDGELVPTLMAVAAARA